MGSLASLQGTGGGRIPMGDWSYEVSRHELTAIIATMPANKSRAMHVAAHQGDTATAQRLLREAATSYFAAPAAPAAALVAPQHRTCQRRRHSQAR